MAKPLSKFGEKFIAYGSYHHNIINKWTHIVCVPIITATLACAISFIPFSFQLAGQAIGLAELGFAGLLIYYANINLAFAMGMTLMMAGLAVAWRFVFGGMDQATFLMWLIITGISAWLLQVLGHHFFEKRRPPFIDNFTQIFTAPLFVVVEVFNSLGIKSAEMKQWNIQIQKNIRQFQKKQRKE